jgi:hypothetical protein
MIHKLKPKIKPEKIIEQEILTWLMVKGVFCWKNVTGGYFDGKRYRKQSSKFAINGVSDILGLFPDGRFMAIEVKSEKGRVSPDQKHFIDLINSNGGFAFVAKSLDEVMFMIEAEIN